ncbi:hypothetical protein EKQ44_09000 [Sutcliffiella horikoshii]|nr:hypothetical protein [Sutcliffiella horikoshii]
MFGTFRKWLCFPPEERTGEKPQQGMEAHGPPVGKRSPWNGNQKNYPLIHKKRHPSQDASLSLHQDYFLIRSLRLDCSIHSSNLSFNVLNPPGAASVWFFTTVA